MSLQHGFKSATTITPSDTVDFTFPVDALLVAAAGNAVVVPASGSATITLTGLAAGQVVPVKTRRVNATGTTATLVGLWGQ